MYCKLSVPSGTILHWRERKGVSIVYRARPPKTVDNGQNPRNITRNSVFSIIEAKIYGHMLCEWEIDSSVRRVGRGCVCVSTCVYSACRFNSSKFNMIWFYCVIYSILRSVSVNRSAFSRCFLVHWIKHQILHYYLNELGSWLIWTHCCAAMNPTNCHLFI